MTIIEFVERITGLQIDSGDFIEAGDTITYVTGRGERRNAIVTGFFGSMGVRVANIASAVAGYDYIVSDVIHVASVTSLLKQQAA